MDLDQLIYKADPARGLEVDVPQPTHDAGRRHHRSWAGVVAITLPVLTAVGVAVVALGIGGHRPARTPLISSYLPFSRPASPRAGAGVVRGSVRLIRTFPDPLSGPGWGMRIYQTRNGMTCVQAGRTESGVVGAIGIYGDFGGDLRFHPFPAANFAGLGECAPNDAHGHAFINLEAVNTPASAGEESCTKNDDASPRLHCPTAALRDVYFGLLGPDATSITYAGPGGRQEVQRTRGRDGAYLVVRPLAPGSCSREAMRSVRAPSSCNASSGGGEGIGATLGSGEIIAVRYRSGHVCHLPAPHGVIVALAQCPVVGYVPPPGPKYTAAQIAAPVTVRKLPARYYCERPGVYRPAALAIPCDGAVPGGYSRYEFTRSRPGHPGTEPGQNLLVYISWTAHGAVKNPEHSDYYVSVDYPKGCNAGGEGTGTGTRVRANQHITRSFYVPTNCRGTYTGQVTYVPDLGPGGQTAFAAGARRQGKGVFLVGRFAFAVP